jgi:catechol 2,3-dioxygenase-like lactoylglutathione lyase family enzyme
MAAIEVPVVTPPQEAVPLPESSAPLKLTGWDHIAFSVPDLVEAERWYVDVLGAEIVGRRSWGGDSEFHGAPHVDVRLGSQILSLFLGDAHVSSPPPRMFHYAFNCRSMDELDLWRDHLGKKGVEMRGPMAHPGFGAVSVYFDDPWGTRLEITTWLEDFEAGKAAALARGGGVMGRPAGGAPRS